MGSGKKGRVPVEAARMKAKALVHHLESVCDRVAIAGSIRRNRPTVGDIEIVVIPKLFPSGQTDLFGNSEGVKKDRILPTLWHASRTEGWPGQPWLQLPKSPKEGARYLRLVDLYLDIPIDLFIVRPPADWGPIFAIRTGPAEFSQRLVMGLRARRLRSHQGRVVDDLGKHVPCPTEKQFFRLAGFRWVEPEKRA